MLDSSCGSDAGGDAAAQHLHLSEHQLRQQIADCRVRSHAIGRPVLMRLHLSLRIHDPWDALDALPWRREAFAAWNDGGGDLCALAYGQLRRQDLAKALDFDGASQVMGDALDQVVDLAGRGADISACDLPLAFAAFSFGDDHTWSHWPASTLLFFRTMVYRARGPDGQKRSGAVIQTFVHAHSAVADISEKIRAATHTLTSRLATRPTHPATGQVPDATLHSPNHDGVEMAVTESPQRWCARVAAARDALRCGALEKVVLARTADFTPRVGSRFAPIVTLNALRASHPSTISFALGLGHGAVFLGATPELLAQVSGQTLRAHALAGTAPRGATPQEDDAIGQALLASLKDRHEHAVVAKEYAAFLRQLCVELRQDEVPHVRRLRQVMHLETLFEGRLRQTGGVLKILEGLHPSPAVGGWPREAGCRWLRLHEPIRRGLYAAPLGWLTGAGDGVFAVAIRSLLMEETRARAFVGAGIVSDSVPEAEWQETELKLHTARHALRLVVA